MTFNKNGEVTDSLIFIITLFILAVGLLVMAFIVPNISQGLRTAGLNNSVTGAEAIDSLDTTMLGTINNGFLIIFVGLILSTLITSFMVRSHPIFLFFYIFFLMVSLFVGVYLGNTYYTYIEGNATLATAVSNTPFINMVMNHIVEITLAVGAVSIIVVFAKFSGGGGGEPL